MSAKPIQNGGTPLHKPLPALNDLTRPFWAAARAGRFVIQRCARCATYQFFPKPWCIECGSRELPWVDAKPTGTLYSHTVSRTVGMNFPGWGTDLPVLMALIDLDDGARMYGQIIGCAPEDLKIGLRVQAVFEAISDEAGIPKFRLLQSA